MRFAFVAITMLLLMGLLLSCGGGSSLADKNPYITIENQAGERVEVWVSDNQKYDFHLCATLADGESCQIYVEPGETKDIKCDYACLFGHQYFNQPGGELIVLPPYGS
ncbi:hypothetical protein J7K50_02265 [bacterium]|nr:hypothetical protein [bacterium]